MSELEKLNVPDSIVEKLRCSLCNGYLSCAPIQLLSDGRSICGHCSLSTHDGSTYRQIAFELVLTETSFPCQFKEYGCKEHVLFGHVAEHEDSCWFRPVPCPSLPKGACGWEGSMNQIPDHFNHNHPTLVMQKIEFKIKVDLNSEGILLALIDNAAFISKFVYNANKRSLQYDIRNLGANINGAHYNIKLINNIVCAFSVSLKGDNCLPYDITFYVMDIARDLNIVKFLPILDNPDEITFAVDVVVAKSEHLNKSEEQVLDSDYCELNKISHFDKAELKEQDYSPATSPCSWGDCNFVGTPEKIAEHENMCPFRLYNCTAYCCEVKFKPEAILTHLMSHGFHYITDEMDFKVVFSGANETRTIFSLKLNRMIYIIHEAIEYRQTYHQITLDARSKSDQQTNTVSLVMEVEHPKYKEKSPVLTIAPDDWFYHHEYLPGCIETTDQFSIIIRIF